MSSRPVMTPVAALDSPTQKTLDVLQSRLTSAEQDAQHLADSLVQLGFKTSDSSNANLKTTSGSVNASGKNRPLNSNVLAPFTLQGGDNELMNENYDSLVTRVCRMESVIQSLKLNLSQAHKERDLSKKDKVAANERLAMAAEAYDAEIKKLNKDVLTSRKEYKDALVGRREAEDHVRRLQQALEEATSLKTEASVALEGRHVQQQKLQRRMNELREEFAREASLRASLEDSHGTLLTRVRDLENVVETERSEVKTLTTTCSAMKRDMIRAQNELVRLSELNQQLEQGLLKATADSESQVSKISSLEEDKNLLMGELRKMHKQYSDLDTQIDQMHHLVDDKQSTHTQLEAENKRLYETMKAASSQNAKLIAKYENELETGRTEIANKGQLEERAQNLLQRLEQETQQKEQAVSHSSELESQVAQLQARLEHQEAALKQAAAEVDAELSQMQRQVKEMTEERDRAVKDKESLLDEVNQAVDGMAEERSSLQGQLQEVQLEVQGLTETRSQLQQENRRLQDRLHSVEDQQSSQKKLESSLSDMLEQKKRLAYEKGRLQTQVEELQQELQSLATTKGQLAQLKKTSTTLEAKYTKSQSELTSRRMEAQRLESELKHTQLANDRKEKDFELALQARDEALAETHKLVAQIETLEQRDKQKSTSLKRELQEARSDNQKIAATLETVMQSHSQLQVTMETIQTELGAKDSLIARLKEHRQESEENLERQQRELDSLHSHLNTVEQLGTAEVEPLKKSLTKYKGDNSKLATNMDTLLKSNSQLQATVETLRDALQKKAFLLEEMQCAREQQQEDHKKELKSYEERMDSIRQGVHKERDKALRKTNKDSADLRKQLEESLGKNGELSRANTDLRHRLTEAEYATKEQKDKGVSLRSQVEHLQRIKKKQEAAIESLSAASEQLAQLEQTKNEYVHKNKEQSRTIQKFIAQIAGLQAEIRTLAKLQMDTSGVVQQQQDTISSHRRATDQLKNKYRMTKKRAQKLEELRRLTEDKLREANNESMQISSSLQDAHHWFKSKFDNLQGELVNARQSQVEMEKETVDTRTMLEEEKRRAEEVAQKAHQMLKSTRETISRLADCAEVSQHDTTDQLRQLRLQAERDRDRAHQLENNYTTFQDASLRHTEELARELDFFKTQSLLTSTYDDTT